MAARGQPDPTTGLTNEQWVDEIYRAVLGRIPDNQGREYWVRLLDNGFMGQGQVYGQFAQSAEGQRELRKRVIAGYQDAFGRDPDAAGLDYTISLIVNGHIGPEQQHIQQYLYSTPERAAYLNRSTPLRENTSPDIEYHPDITNPPDPTNPNTTPGSGAGNVGGLPSGISDRNIGAQIGIILRRYGLESLEGWVVQKMRDGASDAEIMIDLYEQPAFKSRFPALEQRRSAGLPPISPEEYINYEQNAHAIMRAAGLPKGFYDSMSDFTGFIAGNVSLAELSARVERGFVRAVSAAPEIRAQFAAWFGASGDQALASLFLNPDQAMHVLERQLTQAEIGGTGRMFDLDISRARAETLEGMGYTGQTSISGFRQALAMQGLFKETISERQNLTMQDGLDAAFGLNQDTADTIENRRQGRISALSGGGGLMIDQDGIAGRADS